MENITYEEALEQRTAMLQYPHQHPFYTSARAYCDRHGLEEQEQLEQAIFALAHEAFMEEAAPWFKAKADVLALYPTRTYLKSATGALIAVPPELPEGVKEQFRQIDELIENIAKRCGLRK